MEWDKLLVEELVRYRKIYTFLQFYSKFYIFQFYNKNIFISEKRPPNGLNHNNPWLYLYISKGGVDGGYVNVYRKIFDHLSIDFIINFIYLNFV